LLVLLEGNAPQWQKWCEEAHWQFLYPWAGLAEKSIDLRVKALETRVAEARRRPEVDAGRVYLAGEGSGTAALFYVLSRVPDLWAAAAAVAGNPRSAIDSNRIYAANSTLVPVLWLSGDKRDQAVADRFKAAGYNLAFRIETVSTAGQVFGWLASRVRDAFPAAVDCETGSPAFASCYWIQMTKFDPAERNDVLTYTRVAPLGSGALLDLGAFGFDRAAKGPGVLIDSLPPDYRGPLKVNDRLLAVGGKTVADWAAYADMMDQFTEAQPIAVTVERGKDRLRLETRVVLPKRDEVVTARVRGRYLADQHQLEILSRTVTEMRLTVPPEWTPAEINWNGTEAGKAETPGCYLLEERNALLSARKCP
jgi:hypothetical protein